ncbi:hypothetical protein [Aquibacillus saliphilus]|uniref:hypothetical protein n=1 Tax=Aquibacillus saliphilus TaxID=1909422 RepID=UPI001CEFD5A9|nr:hypothetical protein [Aquibacillus saliphilus]
MNIPTILSGPIIRRAEPSQVYIWIATSKPFQIDAKIYNLSQTVSEQEDVSARSETETISIGENLFIHLIKIIPKKKTFPANQLFGYNLFLNNNSIVSDLGSFGLLSPQNPHSIVYGSLKYPSFYIHKQDNTNHILYGSCRKLHGKGNDALVTADLSIDEHHLNLSKRPNALFLMGDQIYADDVADPISHFIYDLGRELIGRDENLALLDSRLEEDPFKSSINKTNGRQFIIEHFGKFTSKNASNHLITLGEYAAMYLLSFGPHLWELATDYGVFDTTENTDDFYFIYPDKTRYQAKRQKEIDKYETRYNEQLEDVYCFQTTLFRVRRALANIPTYMIFDDHDITDDWNLSIDWVNNVQTAPLGNHVVANGLASYWAFQGWGNDPDSFNQSFKNTMIAYFNSLKVNTSIYEEWHEMLWHYDHWHFVAPTEPKAIFLDTRTMRQFDSQPKPTKIGSIFEENIRSPQLISQKGWQKTSKTLSKSGWQTGSQLVIVSPTPLYGIGLIESVLDKYIYPLRVLGIPVESLLDFEAWKYNGTGFNGFLQSIATWNPSDCFILSGDVHYASSVKSTVEYRNGTVSSIYQFTSSPMNNMSFTGVWGSLMKKVIWLNTLKRKRENIYRYCDELNNLVIEDDQTTCPATFNWRETIRYLTTEKESIIETENNLGLLTLEPVLAQNTLLKYFGLYKHEKKYKPLELVSSDEL